ncbi:putative membrane-anchored protein [Fontibacillus solani]|uniref:Putative membrane-anchored protein n=1 Tax=Fontibacillus solani TaxID=1572857 RepID=A0A7W3SQW4_9BACL|nr:DUF1129 family protein [Fontibacillus solani]MBA9084383.1 putative membrane-anchored protein [Fontibacillus solani]
MYIHEMIQETKQLRQQMNPVNEAYFGEMVMYIRSGSSPLTEAKGEEVLLGLARKIVKNQEKDILAKDLFGPDAAAYSKQLAEDVSMRKPRSTKDKIMYYTMIPWIALTWVFFIYMITGFFSKWFGGELEYTLISSASLLLIAALSIVLVELVIRYLGPGSRKNDEQERQNEPNRKFDIKALGIYIGIAVAIVAIGLLLTRIMPSFTVSPWDSLIIFVIGIIGQKFIYGRNKSK